MSAAKPQDTKPKALYSGVNDGRDIENPELTRTPPEHTPPTTNRCLYYYYRWINPWIRGLLVGVPVVYFYAVLLNIQTYRNAHLGEQVLNFPQMEIFAPRPDGRGNYLVMEDLLYEQIPSAPYQSPEFNSWKAYCDFCAFFFNLLVLVICLLRRDVIRFGELFGIHITLYVLMYFTKIITLYPAPSFTEGCMKPEHRELGTWIWREVLTTDFCGDQMFSGHTNNCLVPLIILTRILYDIVGWDLRLWRNSDDYHEPEYYAHRTSETSPSANPGFTDNNEDVFFHPRYHFSETPKNYRCPKVLIWSLVTFWRILKWVIFGFFFYGLIHIRQHYTADITVGMLMIMWMTTNTRYIQSMMRWLYRPNYWNYKRTGPFALVKLRPPLTREQANYEDRIAKLGRGGVF